METANLSARAMINEALRVRLETDLAVSAFVQGDVESGAFSRSRGSVHSKSGHDFSRSGAEEDFNPTIEVAEAAKRAFASRMMSAAS
ncbi:MAG: hypothetical protein V4579_08630 [Pseudomonadota bacterium]